MKNSVLLVLLIAFTHGVCRSQDCMGLKIKPGSGYEMTLYDGKDRVTSTMTYTFKNVRKEGGSTVVEVETQTIPTKGKPAPPSMIQYTCTGNEIIIDMSGMGGGQNPAVKNMDIKLINNDITYPRMLSEGSKLKDGTLQTEAYDKGTKMMEMTMSMTNRKVDGKENLTTPAGTFETYKVSSDLNIESKMMGIPIRRIMRTISYRNSDVLFDIKNESYDKGGKLLGYTVLSKAF